MRLRFLTPVCLLTWLLCAISSGSAHQGGASADTVQVLQGIEQTWANAEKNHDSAIFEQLVSDDWVAITPDGQRQTKAQRSANIKTSHMGSVDLGPMDVRVYGDTAIVTGTVDETTPEKGAGAKHHYAWTDVFVKRNGKWLAVASQTALIQ